MLWKCKCKWCAMQMAVDMGMFHEGNHNLLYILAFPFLYLVMTVNAINNGKISIHHL